MATMEDVWNLEKARQDPKTFVGLSVMLNRIFCEKNLPYQALLSATDEKPSLTILRFER
jgi:hypothetical protein